MTMQRCTCGLLGEALNESLQSAYDHCSILEGGEYQDLHIGLYDRIKTGLVKEHRFLAQVNIRVRELELNKEYDVWEEWGAPPSCERNDVLVTGRVHIRVHKSYSLKVR